LGRGKVGEEEGWYFDDWVRKRLDGEAEVVERLVQDEASDEVGWDGAGAR